ncbi:MAG: vWA domain-containing protein [Rectinemataceae bacterium]
MTFAHPGMLWLSLLALAEFLLSRLRAAPMRASVEALVGPQKRARVATTYSAASFYGSVAGALFVVFAALSLAGPSWGSRGVAAERSGLEATFVLDVSRSMLAVDASPNRLDAAKALIRGLIHGEGASAGGGFASFALVAVKGDAVVLAPMTEDIDSIDGALDYADPDTMTAPGTNLERGIQVGIDAFPASDAADRLLILFTDGGELSGSMIEEAPAIRQSHVRFVAVGLGGSASVSIPGPDGSPLLLPSGLPVRSALQADRLKSLAAAASGRYLDGADAGTSASLAGELADARRGGTRVEVENVDRSALAAVLALLFLLAALAADIFSTVDAAPRGAGRTVARGGSE